MTVQNLQRIFIYHSRQYPGYTCWCGLWNMPDGSIMLCFTEATGPFHGRPRAPDHVRQRLDWPPVAEQPGGARREEYDMTGLDLCNVHLRTTDFGSTWERVSEDHFTTCMNGITGEAEEALSDGTVVRGVWGPYLPYHDVPQTGYIQRSTDACRTWGRPEVIGDGKDYMFWPKRIRMLRDGRVLTGGGLIRRHPEHDTRRGWFRDHTPALFVSEDAGQSWRGPISVLPPSQSAVQLGLTEEFDWAELPGGDLLVVMRADANPTGPCRLQTRLSRDGSTWRPTAIRRAPFPHSGHPELLWLPPGIVLHVATTGISLTADEGENWQDLPAPAGHESPGVWWGPTYYPRSVRMRNGEVLCVGHIGGDNGFGCVDQSIVGLRFLVKT